MVQDGNGWIELDSNGTPLGKWSWDEAKSMWVFEEYPPVTNIPQPDTDDDPTNIIVLILIILIVAGLITGFALLIKHKRRR